MLTYFKDFAVATVSTGYDAAATSITLTTGHGANLPAAPFFAFWWNSTDYATPDLDTNRELVYVGTRSSDALSNMLRGQGDDAASTKNTGGKTYKLMATVSAKELESRSRQIASTGPSAAITYTSGSVELDVTSEVVTIPANFLKAGDVLEWHMLWEHTAGPMSYGPRLGLRLGGSNYLLALSAWWVSTEIQHYSHGTVHVKSIGGSGQINVVSQQQRENGTWGGERNYSITLDTTAAFNITPIYRMDSSGETIVMAKLNFLLHRL